MILIANKEELLSWFDVGSSVNIQMPNEIFDDFDTPEFKSFNHKCFAYAYYYMITYLYRNTLYGNTSDIEVYNQNKIIGVLTKSTNITYITKRDGLLDKIGYTITTTNYPVSSFVADDLFEFDHIKTLRSSIPNLKMDHNPNFAVKEPVKALVRFDDEDFTGTFYSFQNTHRISIQKFITIISNTKLGHVGLYIYGYLSMMCDKFPNGYIISNIDLCKVIGCSERTIMNYTNRLETIGLLESSRKTIGNKRFEKSYCVR